jgi:hypothetical protein
MELFYFVAVLGDVSFRFIEQFLDTPIECVDWLITVLWCILMELFYFVAVLGDVIF